MGEGGAEGAFEMGGRGEDVVVAFVVGGEGEMALGALGQRLVFPDVGGVDGFWTEVEFDFALVLAGAGTSVGHLLEGGFRGGLVCEVFDGRRVGELRWLQSRR